MAYRAKRRSTPKRHKTRRRMSGVKVSRDKITRVLGLVGGGVLTAVANEMITKAAVKAGKTPPMKLVYAGELIVGFLLPSFVKNDLVAGIGDGMIAGGGLGLLKEFNVLSGIPVISGNMALPVVNGVDNNTNDINTRIRSESTRPSVSQFMNGMYHRRPYDGAR